MKKAESNLRRANMFRKTLPFILFAIVLAYEMWEHVYEKGGALFDIHLSLEVLFFGILGPLAVYFVLTYVVNLLQLQTTLNIDLEAKVYERTEKLKHKNKELAQANNELKELDKLKSDFVALVSHELRGPLTTLNGGIELALDEGKNLPAGSRRILEILSLESQRLTHFVQTILDLSRLDAGKLKLICGPVSISPLLKQIIDFQTIDKDRKIELKIQDDLPLAWADEIALEKSICNILQNAFQYSNYDLPIELNVSSKNGNIEISITDYGPGIPKEAQSRIFNRFQRLETGDQINTKGWGLGLFFAKELIEAQGGKMNLKSPIRKDKNAPGAKFVISIPKIKEISDEN